MKKSNQKKLVYIGIGLILVVAVILCFALISNAKQKKVIDTMFSDLKTGNTNKIAEYISNSTIDTLKSENDEENKELKLFFSSLNYKIKSSKKNGNNLIVKTEVTNKDINATLRSYYTTAFSEMLKIITSNIETGELETKLMEYLTKEYDKAETVSREVDIVLTKVDGKWVVDKSEENSKNLMNAILPGYLDYINNSTSNSTEEQ